jgi:DNA-binding transcriptional ArsR family regulator
LRERRCATMLEMIDVSDMGHCEVSRYCRELRRAGLLVRVDRVDRARGRGKYMWRYIGHEEDPRLRQIAVTRVRVISILEQTNGWLTTGEIVRRMRVFDISSVVSASAVAHTLKSLRERAVVISARLDPDERMAHHGNARLKWRLAA